MFFLDEISCRRCTDRTNIKVRSSVCLSGTHCFTQHFFSLLPSLFVSIQPPCIYLFILQHPATCSYLSWGGYYYGNVIACTAPYPSFVIMHISSNWQHLNTRHTRLQSSLPALFLYSKSTIPACMYAYSTMHLGSIFRIHFFLLQLLF